MHFTCGLLLLHSTSYQLHMYFTTALHALHSSLLATSHALHLYFTFASHQRHNNFACTSLLLHLNFTTASQPNHMQVTATSQHQMYFTCTSMLLHSFSQQLHHYFTAALHTLHSNFTASSQQHHMYSTCTSLLLTSTSQQLHCCLPELHNNLTCTLLMLHLHFINFKVTSHA